jgi:hypothetical protein
MGRMIKNAGPKTASHAFALPIGTSSIGPSSPVTGQTRWNTTTARFEYYTGTQWNATAHEGFANLVVSTFTISNVNQLSYGPLSTTYTAGQEKRLLVHLGGVYQIPNTNYTCNGTGNIAFVTGSLNTYNGATIAVVEGLGSTSAV